VETDRFDRLARAISTVLSRRRLTGVLGLGALALPGVVDAKKHKHKKKKIKRNGFGCVDVGGFCQNGGQCCSGICQGKKGKKTCQAHDEGGCQADEDFCVGVAGDCTTGTGDSGLCSRTTGDASFCGAAGICTDCAKDADCLPFCGPQAACIVCAECHAQGFLTACFGPSIASCAMP
jgi:hypothetical protein